MSGEEEHVPQETTKVVAVDEISALTESEIPGQPVDQEQVEDGEQVVPQPHQGVEEDDGEEAAGHHGSQPQEEGLPQSHLEGHPTEASERKETQVTLDGEGNQQGSEGLLGDEAGLEGGDVQNTLGEPSPGDSDEPSWSAVGQNTGDGPLEGQEPALIGAPVQLPPRDPGIRILPSKKGKPTNKKAGPRSNNPADASFDANVSTRTTGDFDEPPEGTQPHSHSTPNSSPRRLGKAPNPQLQNEQNPANPKPSRTQRQQSKEQYREEYDDLSKSDVSHYYPHEVSNFDFSNLKISVSRNARSRMVAIDDTSQNQSLHQDRSFQGKRQLQQQVHKQASNPSMNVSSHRGADSSKNAGIEQLHSEITSILSKSAKPFRLNVLPLVYSQRFHRQMNFRELGFPKILDFLKQSPDRYVLEIVSADTIFVSLTTSQPQEKASRLPEPTQGTRHNDTSILNTSSQSDLDTSVIDVDREAARSILRIAQNPVPLEDFISKFLLLRDFGSEEEFTKAHPNFDAWLASLSDVMSVHVSEQGRVCSLVSKKSKGPQTKHEASNDRDQQPQGVRGTSSKPRGGGHHHPATNTSTTHNNNSTLNTSTDSTQNSHNESRGGYGRRNESRGAPRLRGSSRPQYSSKQGMNRPQDSDQESSGPDMTPHNNLSNDVRVGNMNNKTSISNNTNMNNSNINSNSSMQAPPSQPRMPFQPRPRAPFTPSGPQSHQGGFAPRPRLRPPTALPNSSPVSSPTRPPLPLSTAPPNPALTPTNTMTATTAAPLPTGGNTSPPMIRSHPKPNYSFSVMDTVGSQDFLPPPAPVRPLNPLAASFTPTDTSLERKNKIITFQPPGNIAVQTLHDLQAQMALLNMQSSMISDSLNRDRELP